MSNKLFLALVEEVAKATPDGARNLYKIYKKELTHEEGHVIVYLINKKEDK